MISAENPRASFVGDASEDTFAYTFKIFEESDLLVYVDDVLKTLNTHYTVDMNAGGVGGDVIFEVAYIPGVAAVIDIVRSTPLTQSTDFVEGDRFLAETVEETIDRIVMMVQDIDSKVSLLIADEGITPIPANTIYAMFPFEDVREYASLNAAVTAIGATAATLVVSNAQTLTASLTIPATLRLVVLKGGSIVKAAAYTVTINGTFEAGLFQVFSGFSAGEVVFAASSVALIHHQWFGETVGSHAVSTAAGAGASIPVFTDYPAEADLNLSDNTTANATTAQHGLLPKLPGGTVTFLRADGGWSAVSKVVQVVCTQTGALATGTTVMPYDDTIPQNTEGVEITTVAITPTSATNILLIEAFAVVAHTAASTFTAAIFQDATLNALAATEEYQASTGIPQTVSVSHYMVAGTIIETTFKLRVGSHASGTLTVNGAGAARKMGGVMSSWIRVTEITV